MFGSPFLLIWEVFVKGENKKIIYLLPVLLVLAVIVVNVVSKSFSNNDNKIISAPADKVSYQDVRDYLQKIDFDENNSREIFKNKIINNYTLKYFKFLQNRFKEMPLDEHLAAVKAYLYSSMDMNEAELLFDIYKKYIDYENMMVVELSKMDSINSTSDYLNVLRMMKNKQEDFFGRENAEILFGASIKMKEYPIRRSAIINDNSMYAAEKEKKINKLNKEMWGKDSESVENSKKPYVAYNEKLSLYSKDFQEMSDADKFVKISEMRNEIFPREIVQRLDNLDRELEIEKESEKFYQDKYDSIMSDSSLTATQKQERIYSVQSEIFGDNAELVRRRVLIESGKIDIMEELKK